MARKVEDAVQSRDFTAFKKLIHADLSRIYLEYGNEQKELLDYLSESYYHAHEERSDPNNIHRLMIMAVLGILLIEHRIAHRGGIPIRNGMYMIRDRGAPLPPQESDGKALRSKQIAHMQSFLRRQDFRLPPIYAGEHEIHKPFVRGVFRLIEDEQTQRYAGWTRGFLEVQKKERPWIVGRAFALMLILHIRLKQSADVVFMILERMTCH